MSNGITTEETPTIEPELMPQSIEKRRESLPITIEEIAALPESQGKELIEARAEILRVLRVASIRMTAPQDWLLFKAYAPGEAERITGFLQDSGCQRIRPLWGIEIEPKGDFEETTHGESFAYALRGDGRCAVTGIAVYDIEGVRMSTDDFITRAKPLLTPIMMRVRVKQAARANLDGNITRALAGMKSVAIEELRGAWDGTGKDWLKCPRGRGFGTKDERAGAQVQQADHVPAGKEPRCEFCNEQMKFIAAGTSAKTGKPYDAFWSCPNGGQGKQHERATMPDKQWRETLAKQPVETREPGQEG